MSVEHLLKFSPCFSTPSLLWSLWQRFKSWSQKDLEIQFVHSLFEVRSKLRKLPIAKLGTITNNNEASWLFWKFLVPPWVLVLGPFFECLAFRTKEKERNLFLLFFVFTLFFFDFLRTSKKIISCSFNFFLRTKGPIIWFTAIIYEIPIFQGKNIRSLIHNFKMNCSCFTVKFFIKAISQSHLNQKGHAVAQTYWFFLKKKDHGVYSSTWQTQNGNFQLIQKNENLIFNPFSISSFGGQLISMPMWIFMD